MLKKNIYSSFAKPYTEINLSKFVNTNEVKFDIQVLGLRNLQSTGLLPVKKPTITFNFKSLLPPNCDYSIEDISTHPGPSGSNPTINTKIEHRVPVPMNRILCPSL